MYPYFDVEGISVEPLLHEWRWLFEGEFQLLAVNAFGDLFLVDAQDKVYRLDVTGGTISVVASSTREFFDAANDVNEKREWLLDRLEQEAAQKGLRPSKGQCIGYKVPPVFKESVTTQQNAYVADLYEYVSFMGDVHEQINDVPDGSQVRVKIGLFPLVEDEGKRNAE